MNEPRKVVEQYIPQEEVAELSDETRVALALYLKVYSEGKVTPQGVIVPELNIYKLAHAAEVPNRIVSKTFERLRGKGFLGNLPSGHLTVKNLEAFQQWLISQGASIEI
ncbi:MAG: hypothetical protein HYY52_03125 [Candidatus Melainabacteria bacterium]|nr:hypothetical protein [Candidatus Melainabacteria bacterium]